MSIPRHRRRTFLVFLIALLLLWPSWPARPAGAAAPPPETPGGAPAEPAAVPGELIVGFKPGASAGARDAAVAAEGGRTTAVNDRFNFRVVQLASGQSEREAAAAYLKNPAVRYAEPNYIYSATLDP